MNMNKGLNKYLLAPAASALLGGCSPAIEDGGSCKYQRLEDPAKVTAVTDHAVVLEGVTSYEVPMGDFKGIPAIGEEYIVTALHITEGSCSPVSVHSLQKR